MQWPTQKFASKFNSKRNTYYVYTHRCEIQNKNSHRFHINCQLGLTDSLYDATYFDLAIKCYSANAQAQQIHARTKRISAKGDNSLMQISFLIGNMSVVQSIFIVDNSILFHASNPNHAFTIIIRNIVNRSVVFTIFCCIFIR